MYNAITRYNSKYNFSIEYYFKNVNLDINDDVFVYMITNDTTYNISKESEVIIYEVYKVKTEDTPIVKHYGSWFQDTETLQCPSEDKYERRQNLQVYTVNIKSFSHMKSKYFIRVLTSL